MAGNVVEDYGWRSSEATDSAGYITPAVLSALARLGARRVVDIGAGNGSLCGAMAAAGLNPYGIEYDAAGVAIARKAYPALRFYARGVQDSPADIVAVEGLADAAVSTEVVEHLFAPHLLPKFARELVRPGGHLIVTTPYHGYLKNLALSLADKWDDHHTALWHGGHIKFWSRATLTQLLRENGFETVGFLGVGRLPLLWKSMVLIARAD
jgi:2-polyprenyl-3-methyl-5-hydroxy-6-metoxy-1,4-benzoquinol methylase